MKILGGGGGGGGGIQGPVLELIKVFCVVFEKCHRQRFRRDGQFSLTNLGPSFEVLWK